MILSGYIIPIESEEVKTEENKTEEDVKEVQETDTYDLDLLDIYKLFFRRGYFFKWDFCFYYPYFPHKQKKLQLYYWFNKMTLYWYFLLQRYIGLGGLKINIIILLYSRIKYILH